MYVFIISDVKGKNKHRHDVAGCQKGLVFMLNPGLSQDRIVSASKNSVFFDDSPLLPQKLKKFVR
jgi:hypothetical protein